MYDLNFGFQHLALVFLSILNHHNKHLCSLSSLSKSVCCLTIFLVRFFLPNSYHSLNLLPIVFCQFSHDIIFNFLPLFAQILSLSNSPTPLLPTCKLVSFDDLENCLVLVKYNLLLC